jgi:hypothetical protein
MNHSTGYILWFLTAILRPGAHPTPSYFPALTWSFRLQLCSKEQPISLRAKSKRTGDLLVYSLSQCSFNQPPFSQAFPPALGDSTHDPFFSVEHAPDWITSRGYQLYLEHDDGGEAVGSWNPDNATPTQVRAYRAHVCCS